VNVFGIEHRRTGTPARRELEDGRDFDSATGKSARPAKESFERLLRASVSPWCILALLFASVASAETPPASPMKPKTILSNISFAQNLGQQVSLDTPFVDEDGKPIRLGACFQGRPVLVALVYHKCPMLCNQVMNGLVTCLRGLDFEPGKEFDVVIVSISPTETPALARKKKKGYLARYSRKCPESSWHFLTGTEESIRKLADEVGYTYELDPKSGEYAHPSGITLLTPAGVISHYYYGIDYSTRDMRFGMIEAAEQKIGSPVDQILLLCFHYDPSTGKYNLAVMRVLQASGVMTVAVLGVFVFTMLRRERTGGLVHE
jgi:protein SCO1/2